ncbi:uncharacterized, partial [Tachysurus ichikawai]
GGVNTYACRLSVEYDVEKWLVPACSTSYTPQRGSLPPYSLNSMSKCIFTPLLREGLLTAGTCRIKVSEFLQLGEVLIGVPFWQSGRRRPRITARRS